MIFHILRHQRGLSKQECEEMTLPQLMLHLTSDEQWINRIRGNKQPVSQGRLLDRASQAREGAFDEICRYFRITPAILATKEPAEVVRMATAVLGKKARSINVAKIRAQLLEYVARKDRTAKGKE